MGACGSFKIFTSRKTMQHAERIRKKRQTEAGAKQASLIGEMQPPWSLKMQPAAAISYDRLNSHVRPLQFAVFFSLLDASTLLVLISGSIR